MQEALSTPVPAIQKKNLNPATGRILDGPPDRRSLLVPVERPSIILQFGSNTKNSPEKYITSVTEITYFLMILTIISGFIW